MVPIAALKRPQRAFAQLRCVCRNFSTSRGGQLQDKNEAASLLDILKPSPLNEALKTAYPGSQVAKNAQLFLLARSVGIEHKRAAMNLKDPNYRAILQERVEKLARSKSIERMQTRKWEQGDVYAPHDLSPAEMYKWRIRRKPERDAFDVLGINPMDEWKNFSMLAEYTTTMGRIKHSRDTGLRPVNQRRMARAIRRAVGMGWMPSVHVHPEMLRRNIRR